MAQKLSVLHVLSAAAGLASCLSATAGTHRVGKPQLLGTWELANSENPKTVTVEFTPSEIYLRASCTSFGTEYKIFRSTIQLTWPGIVHDRSCFNKFDPNEQQRFSKFVDEAEGPIEFSLERQRLTLVSAAGTRLTFKRSTSAPP
jgi:hypothetical protein